MPPVDEARRLSRGDTILLVAFCLLLFGISLVGGRVLSVHEARLPQTSLEMIESGQYLFPTSGGRPWMERPPLPHWITCATVAAIGVTDQEWVFRLPPALLATLSVLLLAQVASTLFGRGIGLLSGLMLATQFEFVRYAWLAEEEAYLAAVVMAALALFVHLEFGKGRGVVDNAAPKAGLFTWLGRELLNFCGPRAWTVLGLFVVLGLSNWVKGLFFAAVVALVPMVAWLLGTLDWNRMRRYVWLPGWAVFAVLALSWPLAAYLTYPDVLQIMGFDVRGRLDGSTFDDPWWYYVATVPWAILPWTFLAVAGLAVVSRRGLSQAESPERFLLCWSLLTVLVLSIPSGKHHHYLVPALAPWGVLAALGGRWLWRQTLAWPRWVKHPAWGVGLGGAAAVAIFVAGSRIPGPEWIPPVAMLVVGLAVLAAWVGSFLPQPRAAVGTLLATCVVVYATGHMYTNYYFDRYRPDTEFLQRAQVHFHGEPVFVDGTDEALSPFRALFYLPRGTTLLHNRTFLLDERITAPSVWVVGRARSAEDLVHYGQVELVDASQDPKVDDADRWSLWRLDFYPDLVRVPADVPITPTQAYRIQDGPELGVPTRRLY